MQRLLVIEDGHEYEEFARLFLGDVYEIFSAHSASEALEQCNKLSFDALLVDLRFERSPASVLVGNMDKALQRFNGDRVRATQYLKDQQGTLILAELRRHDCDAFALFVHEFPERRLKNLQKLYGKVGAVTSFDAAQIRRSLAQT